MATSSDEGVMVVNSTPGDNIIDGDVISCQLFAGNAVRFYGTSDKPVFRADEICLF